MMNKQEIKVPLIFMGTSIFAAKMLASLINDKYNIVAIFTQPDRKIGRDQNIHTSPIKKLAIENNLPIFQPEKFDDHAISEIKKLKPDLIIVAAYGKILPKEIIDLPGLGCVNVHASLLPKYRGPSPIQNALLAGETETGVTLMLMNEGIDTGDIISQKELLIDHSDTTATLNEKLSALGTSLLHETLPLWIKRKIDAHPQDNTQATLCQLIEREDGHIIWDNSAKSILDRFRAFTPWPGIHTIWETSGSLKRLKLIDISIINSRSVTARDLGEVVNIDGKIGVNTSEGTIILNLVQLENKQPVAIKDFMSGYPQFLGSILK